mmetsp:Transcript_16507/g.67822  ORF Transcript_16507/g.67822 Transcript_16507/m.67822 type:complete len:278 (-) Transcript_16507:202-1035(-)
MSTMRFPKARRRKYRSGSSSGAREGQIPVAPPSAQTTPAQTRTSSAAHYLVFYVSQHLHHYGDTLHSVAQHHSILLRPTHLHRNRSRTLIPSCPYKKPSIKTKQISNNPTNQKRADSPAAPENSPPLTPPSYTSSGIDDFPVVANRDPLKTPSTTHGPFLIRPVHTHPKLPFSLAEKSEISSASNPSNGPDQSLKNPSRRDVQQHLTAPYLIQNLSPLHKKKHTHHQPQKPPSRCDPTSPPNPQPPSGPGRSSPTHVLNPLAKGENKRICLERSPPG